MLEASAPSTDPRNKSLAYAMSKGIGGAMAGRQQGMQSLAGGMELGDRARRKKMWEKIGKEVDYMPPQEGPQPQRPPMQPQMAAPQLPQAPPPQAPPQPPPQMAGGAYASAPQLPQAPQGPPQGMPQGQGLQMPQQGPMGVQMGGGKLEEMRQRQEQQRALAEMMRRDPNFFLRGL
jgi:hypothetical protein